MVIKAFCLIKGDSDQLLECFDFTLDLIQGSCSYVDQIHDWNVLALHLIDFRVSLILWV